MNGIITRRDVYAGTGGTTYLSQIMDKTITEIDDASITEIHTPLFIGCNNLTSVTLRNCHYIGPSDMTPISNDTTFQQKYPNVFEGCSNLSYVYLPSLSMDILAFNGWSVVNNVYYASPFALTSVETVYMSGTMSKFHTAYSGSYRYGPFNGASKLKTVYLMFSNVVTMAYNTYANLFNGTAITSIYVPASLVDQYKVTSGFTPYSSIILGV